MRRLGFRDKLTLLDNADVDYLLIDFNTVNPGIVPAANGDGLKDSAKSKLMTIQLNWAATGNPTASLQGDGILEGSATLNQEGQLVDLNTNAIGGTGSLATLEYAAVSDVQLVLRVGRQAGVDTDFVFTGWIDIFDTPAQV